jgi:vitamin B12 transporter
MKTLSSPAAWAGITAMLFCASPARADSAMETVIVSASRIPVQSHEVGSAVTVIGREELERRQLAPLSEVLRDVPGLAVSRSGVLGSFTQIRVRGAEAAQVMVLIDGVEANDIAQGSAFNFAHLLAADVEQVEVVRGPQSSLWGSDALAGVISIRTRRGDGAPSLSGFAEGGSFGTGYGGGSVSAGGDRWHFHGGGSWLESRGSDVSRGPGERDGYSNATLTASAGSEVTKHLSFEISVRHVDTRSEFDGAIDFDPDSPQAGLPVDSDDRTESRQTYAGAKARLRLLEGRWLHSLAGGFTGSDNDNFSGGIDAGRSRGRKYKLDYQTSLFLDTPQFGNASHSVTFAMDYEFEDFAQRGTATPFGDPNQDLDMESTGLVAEYRVSFGERLFLSAGGRHDDNSDFRDDATWRVTGSWLLPESGTRLRGSYGTGSKNPTFTDRFGFFAGTPFFVGNPRLKPQRSEGWEAGLDQEFADRRLRFEFTYFRHRLHDEIDGFFFDPALNAFTARNVDGTSRRQGIEISAAVSLSPGLEAHGSYTWLDATEPDAGGRQVREARRPRHSGSANLNYAFVGGRGNLNLNVNHTGAQQDVFFPPPFFIQRRLVLEGFTLVSLAGSWMLTDRVALYGRVENLLDERYEEVLGYRGPGIGAWAGVRINFP